MAVFTAIAGAIFGAGTFLAGATAFVLQTAVGLGLSLAAQALAGKRSTPQAETKGPGFSVQGKLQGGGDVPRSFPLGRAMTAGSLVYANTWGQSGETPNAFMTQIIALSDLPVKGLLGVYVNGVPVTLLTGEAVARGAPVAEYRKEGQDYLWIKFYDGTQQVPDAFCVGTIGSAARPYDSNRIGRGVAYAICTARIEDTLFSGIPNFKFVLDSIPLYDISRDTTSGGDGSQQWSVPSTWGGDGDYLPAVQLYNLARGIRYGNDWLYGLQGVTAARLPASNWIAQIEKCRALETGPSGAEPTYRAGGELKISNEIGNAIEALLTACHGKMAEIGGVYKLHLGSPPSPVMSFTDDDIISTEEQSFTPFFGLSESINGIAARYPEPAEAYNIKPAPPLYRTDLEAKDGGRRLLADVAFDLVPYAGQVQRLMKAALEEAQRARRHTFVLPPKFWLLEPGDIVEWTSARNGYATKLFRVDGVVDKANLDVIVDLTEVDPSDFDWDQEIDFEPPTTGPVIIVRPPAQEIIDWAAFPAALLDADGLSRRPAIRLTWNGSQDDIVAVEYEVRLAVSQAVVARGRTENFSDGEVIVSQGILPQTAYQVRGRYVTASKRETLYSAWINVTTPDVRFSIKDFDDALRNLVTEQTQTGQDSIRESLERIAAIVAEIDSVRDEDKGTLRRELARAVGDVRASFSEAIEVGVGPGSAVARQITELYAAIANAEASLKISSIVGVTPDGAIAAYELQATAESARSGFTIVAKSDGAGGAIGEVHIEADRFYVGKTGETGFDPIFIVDNTTNPARVVLRGDLIADGSITANKLNVAVLSAISADIGSITSGRLQSPNGRVDFNLNAGYLDFYD